LSPAQAFDESLALSEEGATARIAAAFHDTMMAASFKNLCHNTHLLHAQLESSWDHFGVVGTVSDAG